MAGNKRSWTNAEIGQLVFNLGNKVQDLAEAHYSSRMSEGWDKSTNPNWKYRRYLELTTPESPKYRLYLVNTKERPKVIASYIWRVLVYEIFECFHWLGAKQGRNFRELREHLRPEEGSAVPESARRQFNSWSSGTAVLLSLALDKSSADEKQLQVEYKEKRIKHIATNILTTLGPGGSAREDVQKDLIALLEDAWNLDVALTKDSAEFSWKWGPQPSLTALRQQFHPDTDSDWDDRSSRDQPLMQPQSQPPTKPQAGSSEAKKDSRYIRLVCSPALVKTFSTPGDVNKVSTYIFFKRLVSLTSGKDPKHEKLDSGIKIKFSDSEAANPVNSPIKPILRNPPVRKPRSPGPGPSASESQGKGKGQGQGQGEQSQTTPSGPQESPLAQVARDLLRSPTVPLSATTSGVRRDNRPSPLGQGGFRLLGRSNTIASPLRTPSPTAGASPKSATFWAKAANSPFKSLFNFDTGYRPGSDFDQQLEPSV